MDEIRIMTIGIWVIAICLIVIILLVVMFLLSIPELLRYSIDIVTEKLLLDIMPKVIP